MASSIKSVSPGMCIILPALSSSGERMKNLVELPVTHRKSVNFTPLVLALLVFLGARSASHVSEKALFGSPLCVSALPPQGPLTPPGPAVELP
jgi:hypothetical protein